MKRLLSIFALILMLAVANASAQDIRGEGRKGKGLNGSAMMDKGMIRGSNDLESNIITYGKYTDTSLEELKKQMEQREWGSEDTAWQRARSIGTKEAFQKYIGMYPNGVHRPEATKALIDLDLDDIFKGSHSDFPKMNRVIEEDSPTSTVVVENLTQYTMTVMYSGPDSKCVHIPPGSKTVITVSSGSYRVGAAVPVGHVRPFAGVQDLRGGRYEVGFVISHH